MPEVTEPVGVTCPLIDEAIASLRNVETTLTRLISFVDERIITNDLSKIRSIVHSMYVDRCSVLETLRDANSKLREWGNDWCAEAESLREDNESLIKKHDDLESRTTVIIQSLQNQVEDLRYKSVLT